MDQLLGRAFLGRRFFEMTGFWPDRQNSMDPDQFGEFKSRELPRLVFGRFRHLRTKIFVQVYALYKSGAPIAQQIDKAITAEARVRRPLWLTRRWLCIVTFGYFGLKAGETFYERDTAKLREDREYVLKILNKHFFDYLPSCEQHLPGLELELKELLPPPVTLAPVETHEPLDESPAPPPEEGDPVPPPEEPVEEEVEQEPEIDEATLSNNAVEDFNNSMTRLQTDIDGWDNPVELLSDHDSVLLSDLVQGYHPEPQIVQREIESNRLRLARLESFDAEFEALLQQDRGVDEPWGVPWADSAAADMVEAGFLEIADIRWFRRLAVRHYVMSTGPETDPQGSDNRPPPAKTSPDNDPSPSSLTVPKGF